MINTTARSTMYAKFLPRLPLVSMLLAAAAWLAGGCNSSDKSAPPAQAAGTQAGSNEPPCEVVVIATQHFISDMPEGYTPAHLRALLAKIKPDVVAVEAPTNMPDPWPYAPYDCWKITKPWADEHKIPAAPVGWLNSSYQIELAAMFQEFQQQGKGVAFQAIEQAFQVASAQQPMTCAFMNSGPYHDLWRSYHQKLHDLYGRKTAW